MNADFINLCLFYYTSCSPTDLFSPIVVSYVKSGDTPEPQPTEMFSVTLSLQDDFDVTSDIDTEEDHEYPVPKGRSFVFTLKSSTPPSSTSMIIPSAIKDGDDPTLLDGTLQSDGSTLFVVENVTESETVTAEGRSMPYVYITQGTFNNLTLFRGQIRISYNLISNCFSCICNINLIFTIRFHTSHSSDPSHCWCVYNITGIWINEPECIRNDMIADT